MNREDKYNYWLDAAEYDMNSAEAMLAAGRYVYVVFMCQQALEKLAKGLYHYYIDDNIPRVHNISFIIEKVCGVLACKGHEERFKLFDRLSAYYLQGRYPSFKEKISRLVDQKEAVSLYDSSREAFQWIKSLKK